MIATANRARTARACAVLSLALIGIADAAVWQNEWTMLTPPEPITSHNAVVFAAGGDVLLLSEQAETQGVPLDNQFVRFTPGGAVRWTANVPFYDTYEGKDALAFADGSAVIASDSEAGLHLARIDATGNLLWNIPFASAQPLDAQSILATTAYAAASVDLASGHVRWLYATPNYPNGYLIGAAADAQGSVYAASAGPSYISPTASIVKLDAAGAVLWTMPVVADASGSDYLIGAGADNVYFLSGSTLYALRVGDGSPAWSQGPVYGVSLQGNPAEPVVTTSGGQFERLNAASGAVRWSLPASNNHMIGALGGDPLLYDGTQLTRIGGVTGSTQWTTAVPFAQGQQVLGAGGCATNAVCVVVSQASFPDLGFSLLRFDASSGAAIDTLPVPSVAQAVNAVSFRADADHIVAVGVIANATGREFFTRGLDAATGAELWRTDLTWAAGQQQMPGVAHAGGATIVSVAAYTPGIPASWMLPAGHAYVAALDDHTGAPLWHHEFYDTVNAQGTTYVGAPLVDGNGDVFVAYTADTVDSSQWQPVLRRAGYVVKLSGSDGSELWRFDATSRSSSGEAPRIILLGNDVLVSLDSGATNPVVGTSSGAARLSGSSGTVLWTSPLFAQYGASATLAYNGILVALGSPAASVTGWGRIDPATGATLWSNTTPYPTCTTNINRCMWAQTQLTLPNGDQLSAGELDSHAVAQVLPATAGAQARNFQLSPPGSTLRSYVRNSALDDNGAVWLQKNITVSRSGSGIVTIAQFDAVTGAETDAQAIGAYFNDVLAEQYSLQMLAAPQSGRLLVDNQAAGALVPSTQGNAALDVAVTAHGDLALAASTDRRTTPVGGLVGFHIVATYTGDVPANAVNVFAKLPWALDAASVVCNTQAADNCSVDVRSGNVRGSANLQPGGMIDIHGVMRALPGAETNSLSALVYGAPGLVEHDMEDNFATATIAESLFADGFE